MKIKVCGMKHSHNIKEVSNLNIDYMGFIFYSKSKRYAADTLTSEDIKGLPKHIEPVGVFVNETKETIIELSKKYNFQTLQLHGDEDLNYIKEIKPLGFTLIKAFAIDEKLDFKNILPYQTYCDYFLFDTKSDQYGGSGKKFDWELLKNYNQKTPFFLSGGISIENIHQMEDIQDLNIHALDLNSKFEIEPGLKNPEDIKAFISKVEDIYS